MFDQICSMVYEEFQDGVYGEELFFLAEYGTWGGMQDSILVYKKDEMMFVDKCSPDGTVISTPLEETDFQTFKSFVEENQIDALPDWDTFMVWDGSYYEYLHCTKEQSVSFYMNNPEFYGGSPVFDAGRDVYEELVNRFKQLL